MKTNYLTLFFAMIIVLLACDEEIPPTTNESRVEVINGSQTNNYTIGDSIFVWSLPPSNEKVFDQWTGDIQYLENSQEWKSKMIVPSNGATLTATYRTVPVINFTNEVVNGSQVYYAFPNNYKGIIFPFHGAGGSASGWLDRNVENFNFVRYALANGYAVVITESKDRVNKRWDNAGSVNSNTDIKNIDAILNNLQTRNITIAGKPLFAVGMSQGSGFASLISALKDYKAAALYCAPGIRQVFEVSTVPVLWNMAKNDVTEEPTRLADAQSNYNKLKTRNIRSAFYVNESSPVKPIRFLFLTDNNLNAAIGIYNDLKKGNWLDEKDYFKVNPRQNDTWKSSISNTYQSLLPDIEDQLFVCYTEHKFFKDANYRTIQFFNQLLT